MNISAQHRLQRLGIKRSRPRRQQALFLDVHGLESRIAKGIGDLGDIAKDRRAAPPSYRRPGK
jgi:hypothetical protein